MAHGMRRSVDAVLLVHNHGHPHILLLQNGASYFKLSVSRRHERALAALLAPMYTAHLIWLSSCLLFLCMRACPLLSPGGRLRPGEDEVSGLKRKLTKRLAAHQPELRPEWEVSGLLATWWRPHFEPNMVSRRKRC
jgi:cleavage and polyadenylation specificity factor subunit 5